MDSRLRSAFMISSLVMISLLFTTCDKKEDPDPCETVICLNGGTCVSGTCSCPKGYEGVQCEKRKTPVKITINSITIDRFPATNGGTNWDLFDGPDIYIAIGQGTTLIHLQPTIFENADASQTYIYYPNSTLELVNPTAEHEIDIFDYDDGFSDEFMGGILFTPYVSLLGFRDPIVLDVGDVAFSLDVSYTW
ncbi:MAG: calcium-binding EGF-like domain-containing protein [Vicingaceae bacterium]